MGDNEFDLTMGSTMQLYQGDVGLQPVLQIAGACLARETRRLASARPLGILRGARVTRAASPRRLQRFQRCLSTRGFARSTDHHPRYRLPADLRALENKTEGAEKRYRVMLSDGVHYVTAMLTSSLNQYVADDKLKKFSVIKLKDYFANEVNNRKYVPARARRVAPRRHLENLGTHLVFPDARRENAGTPCLVSRSYARREPNAAPSADRRP